MNPFITPTMIGVRTVAFFTIVSLIVSALPVSFFMAQAEELPPVEVEVVVADVDTEVVEVVEEITEEEPVVPTEEPEVVDETTSTTEPVVETEVVPPQEEEVIEETARFQSFSAVVEDVQIPRCENLLTNGSFEEPVVTASNLYQFFGAPSGWMVKNVSDGADAPLEFHRGWSGNQAAHGSQYVEMDPHQSVRISQSVNTLSGGVYRLSWAFAARHNIAASQNQLGIEVNGSTVETEGPGTGLAGLTPSDWIRGSYEFTATALTEVAFKDLGTPSDSYGTFLDDAQLCLVREPEPTTVDITMCKYDQRENPVEGWDMLLKNDYEGEGELSYEVTTGKNGCVTVAVDPDDGPWFAYEETRTGWSQVDVYAEGGVVSEGEGGMYCSFFGRKPVDFEDERTVKVMDYEYEEGYRCNFMNEQEEVPVCTPGKNLVVNGGFETPELPVDGFGWDIFDSEVGGLAWLVEWLFPTEDSPEPPKLELQRGYTASEGVQYAELDSNWNPAPGGPYDGESASVRIAQTIQTIPGYEYTVSYDFSPLPRRGVDNNILISRVNGVERANHVADGTGLTDTSWTTYSYTFVATDDVTTISFEDGGAQDTFGTLIDDVSVSCVGEDEDDEKDRYTLTVTITGEGSGTVSGDGISCVTGDNEEEVCSFTYSEGTVVDLSAIPDEGSNFDNSWTVGAGTCTGNNTPCAVTMNANVDLTAHFDLNDEDDSTLTRTGRRGGGGGTPRVLGDATSTPMVLGEQVSAVPYGAPDTGAGGMSPLVGLTLLSVLYTGSRRIEVLKK